MGFVNFYSFLLFAVTATALEFPSEITICKKKDSACLNKAMLDVVKYFANGSKEYGVPRIEPFMIKEVHIAGIGGSIDLEQFYHDVKIFGLTNIIPNDITITENGSELVFVVNARASSLSMVGTYEAKGKMLLFQINGGGFSNLTLENVLGRFHIRAEIIEKNGEKYLKTKDFDINFDRVHLILDFKNLVDNNAELSMTVLDAMNANSQDVFDYLKRDYEKMLSSALKSISDGVFSIVPYNKLFLD